MKTLIRGATVLAMDAAHGARPFEGDILIEGERIAAIGADLGDIDAQLIDGCHRLVMPGLVNAHTHSSETFFKGRYQHMPLEIWILYAYPLLPGPPISERLLYLRTLLLAMESLRGGVTMLCDDYFDMDGHSLDRLGTVFQAYEDAGIRANVSSAVMDLHVLDTMPYIRDLMPEGLQRQIASEPLAVADYVAFCEAAFARFQDRAGRLRFMVAPSAPQRCTPELMLACRDLAEAHAVPFHTHVLETKTQAVTGPELYGKSLVRMMHDIGVLGRGTTIAHSVWVSDDDIRLMGASGCSIAHNCISNQKLGAGLAPLRRLIDAGVNVALGTDGLSSNDTARIFDVMRSAALVHCMANPDPSRWIQAAEILAAATLNGARSARLEHETGSLEVGKKADLLVLRLTSLNFTPLNDLPHHLVYCENGSSIERVMVNGTFVVENGTFPHLDEAAILDEIRTLVPPYLEEHGRTEARNRAFEPFFAEMHRRVSLQDIGIDRYAGDEAFPGRNLRF